MDLLPTLLDYLNIQHPGQVYKGRQLVPLRGRSIYRIYKYSKSYSQ